MSALSKRLMVVCASLFVASCGSEEEWLLADDPEAELAEALANETTSPQYGGEGGAEFSFRPNLDWKLAYVRLHCGAVVDGIEMWWKDSAGRLHASGKAGGNGGTAKLITVPPTSPIALVEGHVRDGLIYGLNFLVLDSKNVYQSLAGWCGQSTPPLICNHSPVPGLDCQFSPNYFSASSNGQGIQGISGRAGWYIDATRFHFYNP